MEHVLNSEPKTMRYAVAILLLGVVVAPAARAAEMPADLASAIKAYDRAQTQNDVPALERLVTDDYVLVNSNGTVENKQEFLADFNLPGFKIDPYELRQPVEKVWGDAAVLAGLLRLAWTQDGVHQTRLLRVVYVWAKRDGRWQVTHTQVTRVGQ